MPLATVYRASEHFWIRQPIPLSSHRHTFRHICMPQRTTKGIGVLNYGRHWLWEHVLKHRSYRHKLPGDARVTGAMHV